MAFLIFSLLCLDSEVPYVSLSESENDSPCVWLHTSACGLEANNQVKESHKEQCSERERNA